MSKSRPEVLGFGVITIDDVLYVDAIPQEDCRARVRERHVRPGGNAACALATAARLGAKAAFIGRLGDDEHSRLAKAELAKYGVDQSYVLNHGGTGFVLSTIIVGADTGQRTVLSDRTRLVPVQPEELREEWFDGPRVLMVDYLHQATALRAAKLARAAGMDVISDFEREGELFEELIPYVDHFICSAEFALAFTGCDDPVEAVRRMRGRSDHRMVAVTVGQDGCYWAISNLKPIYHQPAMKVEAADTTGCGDVFRGAYSCALLKGWDVKRRILWSTAAAGLMAAKAGGWTGIPTAAEVEQALCKHPPAESHVVC